MTAQCGNCGASVELGDALVKGEAVVCHNCGAEVVKAMKRKKSAPRPAETEDVAESDDAAGSAASEPARKSELKLRKTLKIKPEPPAPEKKLYDPEIRVKTYEQMKHRMFMRKFLKNAFDVAVLLGLLSSLWFVYKAVDRHLDHRRELAEAERAAAAKQEAERIERERKERERQKAEREAENERRRLERERKVAEEEAARKEKEQAKALYRTFLYAVRENDFDMFNANVTNKLAEAGGELCYLLPLDTNPRPPLYWVTHVPGEAVKAIKIEDGGKRTEINYDEFAARIDGLDYMVAKEGMAYYHARRTNPRWGMIEKGKPVDPSEMFFAGLYPVLDCIKPVYDELVFDVIFYPSGNPNNKIICETLEFGDTTSPAAIRSAVEKAFPPRAEDGAALKVKKFHRTVKFWNGSHVKRGIDGITYVPRIRPPTRYHSYHSSDLTIPGHRPIYRSRTIRLDDDNGNWETFRSLASQEEQAEAKYYEAKRSEYEQEKRNNKGKAATRYVERIDGILKNGKLYFHARKRKGDERQP